MKTIEIIVYILFALAVFLAFGLELYSAIVLLITFIIIDRKIKKESPDKAKLLNRIGYGIVALLVILFLLKSFLAYQFLQAAFRQAPLG